MVEPIKFYECLVKNGYDFFAGVPDSLLKEFCSCIKDVVSSDKNIITANEGNAVALACGYRIATGKTGVVYMQNSGLGNAVNPMLSLADEKVYGIPVLYIIGYRGEPGKKDEPQHVTQGELTLPLLETLGIKYWLADEQYEEQLSDCRQYMRKNNRSAALIVQKDYFGTYSKKIANQNSYPMTREDALFTILGGLHEEEFVVSTTGKASREIYEIREKNGMSHENDFLTVGSMGHASSLALGISLSTAKNIYCIDGDGALIMHMGALAVAIQNAGENFKYILINNGCHESVGGQPTVSYSLNLPEILKGFGFTSVVQAKDISELEAGLCALQQTGKMALIVYTNSKSREELGRPVTTPKENRECFEKKLRSVKDEGTYF